MNNGRELHQKRKTVSKNIFLIAEWFIAVYALLGDTTALLSKGYDVNIPVIKYGFVLLRYFDGWGIEKLLMAVGIGVVFYLVRDFPAIKNKWLRGFCAFLAICTVFGKSYLAYNSWDYVFKWWMQFVIAVFVMAGYYFTFLHFFCLAILIFTKRPNFSRTDAKNKLERFLFEEHPFWAIAGVSLLFLLPYLIAFFPGSLHCDALEQLWRYWGIIEMNGHHPVMSTLLMGKCIETGKVIFHSDSIGLFLYTGGQCLLQCLGIAYMMCFLRKVKSPMWLRWFSLAYFLIFPMFPMWAITFVKDSLYYIFTMFFVTTIAYLIHDRNTGAAAFVWQKLLLIVSALGMTLNRNNGVYVVALTAIVLLFLHCRRWKLWLLLIATSLCTYLGVEKIYLPSQGIATGEIGEALSIPLQQTARYIVEHDEEITQEERETLEELFGVELSVIAERYDPEVSDSVKELFIAHPSANQLKSYFRVWLQQFRKHPDTYVQAFLNQNYGYFYPNRKEIQPDLFIFYFNGWEKWDDGTMMFEHAIESTTPRKFFENYCYSLYNMPVVGMLFSAGMHVCLLLGAVFYLAANKKKRQLSLLVPSLAIILICLASPVNAKIRYMLPVMAVLPLNIAWCIYTVKETDK